MGSLFGVIFFGVLFLPVGFALGQGIQSVVSAMVCAFFGAFAGIAYWLYKPLNPFSDNFYAPKSFTRLTKGELRALAYQNSAAGRWLATRVAVVSVIVPLLGSTTWQLGWVLPFRGIIERGPSDSGAVFLLVAWSFLTSIIGYIPVCCHTLYERWSWIQEHQPLPAPEVLAKYSKGKKVGSWDHLYGTDYSKQMDRALEGKLSKPLIGSALTILGAGFLVIALKNLVFGTYENFGTVVIVMVLGLIVIIAGRMLSRKPGS